MSSPSLFMLFLNKRIHRRSFSFSKTEYRLLVFRPTIIVWHNFNSLGIINLRHIWCSLVFLFFEDVQMGENLLYHRPLVDKAYDSEAIRWIENLRG